MRRGRGRYPSLFLAGGHKDGPAADYESQPRKMRHAHPRKAKTVKLQRLNVLGYEKNNLPMMIECTGPMYGRSGA